MAFDVYDNPDNFTVGSQFFGVVSISVSTTKAEIHASADDDTHETVARYGTGRTGGTITFVDPGEAERAKAATGTMTFTFTDVKASTNISVSISNASIGGHSATVSRDVASTATVPFIAEAAPVYS